MILEEAEDLALLATPTVASWKVERFCAFMDRFADRGKYFSVGDLSFQWTTEAKRSGEPQAKRRRLASDVADPAAAHPDVAALRAAMDRAGQLR